MLGASRDAWILRGQIALALLLLAISLLWLTNATLRDPGVPFLTRVDDPTWITPYYPAETDGIRAELSRVPVHTFVGRFALAREPSAETLWMRALGEVSLHVNGTPLWRSPEDTPHVGPAVDWKRPLQREVSKALRVGTNEVQVRVANAWGPALLQLRIEDQEGGVALETGSHWQVIGPDGQKRAARRADDTRPSPESFDLPSVHQALATRAPTIGLLFSLGVALHLTLGRRRLGFAPEATLAAATLFWIAVYAGKTSQLPLLAGFDSVGHLAYVEFLLERHALPVATDGWSMYHPPLGHATIAGLAALFDLTREDAAARWLYRLPTFLSGLANVWAVAFTAHRLLPGEPLRASLAVGFAALLPMNVYMSAYVSNEPLHSALVSGSLCLACGLLCTSGAPFRRVATLVLGLALAILTKFTALIAVPLVAFFLALKRHLVDGRPLRRAAASGAGLFLGVALLGGWYYLRNWKIFGRPLIGNWELPGEIAWYQQPGFHTLDYYTSFGRALSYPYFAGFASFWDGVYSTFWGDGLAAGVVRLAERHQAWNYDFMTVCYALALPATVLLGLGIARGFWMSLKHPDVGRRLALCLLLSFLYLVTAALVTITLRLPFYAVAKAFYLLSAIVPLSIFAGLGLAWPLEVIPERAWPVRTVYVGWLACLGGSIALAFLG